MAHITEVKEGYSSDASTEDDTFHVFCIKTSSVTSGELPEGIKTRSSFAL
jgi:hypothetical protein